MRILALDRQDLGNQAYNFVGPLGNYVSLKKFHVANCRVLLEMGAVEFTGKSRAGCVSLSIAYATRWVLCHGCLWKRGSTMNIREDPSNANRMDLALAGISSIGKTVFQRSETRNGN